MNHRQVEIVSMKTTSQPNKYNQGLIRLFFHTRYMLPISKYNDLTNESVSAVLNELIEYESDHESPLILYERCNGRPSQLDQCSYYFLKPKIPRELKQLRHILMKIHEGMKCRLC